MRKSSASSLISSNPHYCYKKEYNRITYYVILKLKIKLIWSSDPAEATPKGHRTSLFIRLAFLAFLSNNLYILYIPLLVKKKTFLQAHIDTYSREGNL